MFDGAYLERNQKFIKEIINFYGHKFFYSKRIVDVGAGYGDISGALTRLGADVNAIDARQEHLKVISKKFPVIKTIKHDLDRSWYYHGKIFDMILDLGILCHLTNYESHLKEICFSATHLILETSVCDSEDPFKCVPFPENKNIYDLSVNGNGCRPSVAAIERILTESGMDFRRIDNSRFNHDKFIYDWLPQNNGDFSFFKRRIWFAVKKSSTFKFAKPEDTSNTSLLSVPQILPPNQIPSYMTGLRAVNKKTAICLYGEPSNLEKLSLPQNMDVFLCTSDEQKYNCITKKVNFPDGDDLKKNIFSIQQSILLKEEQEMKTGNIYDCVVLQPINSAILPEIARENIIRCSNDKFIGDSLSMDILGKIFDNLSNYKSNNTVDLIKEHLQEFNIPISS